MSQAILIALSCVGAAGALCVVLTLASCGETTLSDKDALIEAAQTVTEAAFTAGAPVLNDAVQALPPEVQLLVQAGYGALRKAVEAAEASQLVHPAAQAAISTVAQAADSVHDAVHATDVATSATP